jgi:hypothetical protein
MSSCNFIGPGGRTSILHTGLSQLLGDTLATQAWYKLREPRHSGWMKEDSGVDLDENGEPTIQAALQLLGYGDFEATQQQIKLVDRWKLKNAGVPGVYFGTRRLASAMAKQLAEKSSFLYNKLDIRYNATTARIEIRPLKLVFNAEGGERISTEGIPASQYYNHSGGALGADSEWDNIGRQFGVIHHYHYWYGTKNPKSKDDDEITKEEFNEGKQKVLEANRTLKRKPEAYMNKLARNWMQVANASTVFAITSLVSPTEAKGGTGWAVQMAIDNDVPVFVFDQTKESWFAWNGQKFVSTGTPRLTQNFAGIGTREINAAGLKAIKDVYERTFGIPEEIENDIKSLKVGTSTVGGIYEGQITELADNQVFVFGANDQGLHGKGSAGAAMGQERSLAEVKKLKKGTKGKWTVIGEHSKLVEGEEGKSYPLVTVAGEIGNKHGGNRLDPAILTGNIAELYKIARENPNLEFLVAYSGNNARQRLNSGYTAADLADYFASMPAPDNVVFEKDFTSLMRNSPKYFVSVELSLQDQALRTPMRLNEEIMTEARKQLNVEILDGEGKPTGKFFSASQQIQATDSIIFEVAAMVNAKKRVGIDEVRSVIRDKWEKLLHQLYIPKAEGNPRLFDGVDLFDHITQEMAATYRPHMEDVLNTLDPLIKDALNRLAIYGVKVTQLGNVGTEPEVLELEDNKSLERMGDLIFTLDPRDTASGRLKLFLATVPKVSEGIMPRPKVVKVPMQSIYMQEIINGDRKITVRTEEQLRQMRLQYTEGKDKGSVKFGDQWYTVQVVKRLSAADAAAYNSSEDTELRSDNDLTPHEAKEGDYLLQFSPYVQQRGLTLTPSFIGTPVLADFESLFEDVTGVLADREASFEDYVNTLRTSSKPELKKLADKLEHESTPLQVRREFVSVMTKSYTQYALTRFQNSKNGMRIEVIDANQYSARKVIQKTWREQQKLSPIVQRNAAGHFILNKELISELRREYDELSIAIGAILSGKTVDEVVLLTAKTNLQARELAKKMFNLNGVTLNDDAFNDLFDNIAAYTKGTSFEGNILQQWGKTLTGEPTGIFSAFMLALTNEKEDADAESELDKNNPLYRETQTMNLLARIQARHAETLYNSSHRNMDGKNIWDFTLPSYLSRVFTELTGPSPVYRAQLKKTDFAGNNWLLNIWENVPKDRQAAQLFFVEGLSKMRSSETAERDAMSDRDQLLMALGMFTNKGNRFAHFMSLTHSDKTRTPLLYNIPRTRTMDAEKYSPELYKRLRTVFYSEFDRISNPATFSQRAYEQGKKYFFLLPQFNYANMVDMVKRGEITEQELALIWVAPGVINSPARALNETLVLVDKMLTRFIESESTRQRIEIENAGLVNYKEGKHFFDERYVEKSVTYNRKLFRRMQGGKESFFEVAAGRTNTLTKSEYLLKLTEFVATDFAMNNFLVNTAMSQLMFGDPAQTFKKDVDSTLVEYQKRLAGPIAPGKEAEWEEDSYKSITLADFKVGLDYIDGIPAYREAVNVTDAQEFVTVAEHLYVMRMYGMIAEDIYQEMSAIDARGEEFTEPRHLNIILQPTKPVYFGKRYEENRAIMMDYVKSSAIPLYRGFTKGTQLDNLRIAMEDRDIRRAHFESARKIGMATPIDAFTEDGTFIGFDSSAAHDLYRSGFRIQQEVPYDRTKQEIQIFSQANKLIVADLPASIQITTPGSMEPLDRAGIRQYKENLRIKMLEENYKEFAEELQVDRFDLVDEDGEVTGDVLSFADDKVFLERMLREAKEKNYSINELTPLTTLVDGKPVAPLFFTSLADPLQNMMMAMVDTMTKVKIPGRSFVQASSVGITTVRNDIPTGVHFYPGHDSSKQLRMPYKDADGNVQPAEILVPFHMFSGNKKLKLQDFMDDSGVIDPAKLPVEVLHMVGIRIPTSKHNTMLPMRIVGFLPENMGDTIIVPPGITTQMGSDFDVDKLFVYQRPYELTEKIRELPQAAVEYLKSKLNSNGKLTVYRGIQNDGEKGTGQFWTSSKEAATYYAERYGKSGGVLEREITLNDAINSFVGQEGNKGPAEGTDIFSPSFTNSSYGLSTVVNIRSEYFNVFWQVLTHPDVYNMMMSPLDKMDLKEEAKLVKQPKNRANFFTGLRQREDFISQKDAKRLIGFSALTNTLLADTQHLNLRLGALVPDEQGMFQEVPVYVTTFNGLRLNKISGYGMSEYQREPRTKMDNIGILLQEFLDHAKNRTIDKLNITVHTYSGLAALLSLEDDASNALDISFAARLARQEYIQKLNDMMTRGNDMLSGYVPNLKETVFEQLDKELEKKGGELLDVSYNRDELLAMIDAKKDKEYYSAQRTLLNTFKYLDEVGTRMSEISALTNQDVRGTEGNIFSVIDKIAKVSTILGEDLILGADAITAKGTEKGYLFDTILGTAYDLFDDYLPHKRLFDGVFKVVQDITGKRSFVQLSMEAKKSILKGVRSFSYAYIMEHGMGIKVQPERARLMYDTEQGPSLAKRVMEAQHTWGRDNFFLKRLNVVIQDGNRPNGINFIAAKVTRMDDNENVRAWIEMLMSPEREVKLLAEDLVRYAFLTGGVQDATSFVKYVPFGYLNSIGWFDGLTKLYNNLEGFVGEQFVEQWFRHNPGRAVQTSSRFADLGLDIEGIPEFFSINQPDPKKLSATDRKYMIVPVKGGKDYTPYISYRTDEGQMILYKLTGRPEGKITYTRIDTLGDNVTDEYAPQPSRSILTDNRAYNDTWIAVKPAEPMQPMQRALDSGIPVKVRQQLKLDSKVTTIAELHSRVIPELLASGELPGVYQTLLSSIGEIAPEHARVLKLISKAAGTVNKDLTIELNDSDKFSYNLALNKISIPADQAQLDKIMLGDASYLQETFVHELIHYTTAPYIAAATSEYFDTPDGLAGTTRSLNKNSKVMQSARKIVEIYDFVKNNRTDLLTRYQLTDVHEFIVGTMTNRNFMAEMNATDYMGGTMLSKVWDLLSKLFDSITEFLGAPVRKGSVLEAALPHMLAVATNERGIEILDVRDIDGVQVGVDRNGWAVKVSEDFMHGQPEPQRQAAIKKIIAKINKDSDAPTEQSPLSGELFAASASIANGSAGPWQYRSEQEAALRQKELERILPGVSTTLDGASLILNAAPRTRNTTGVPTPVVRIIERLEQQKDAIAASMSNLADRTVRAEKRYQLQKIDEDIQKLLDKKSLAAVSDVGVRQLTWISKVAKAEQPSATELQTAWKVSEVWTNMVDILYGNNSGEGLEFSIDEKLAKVKSDADSLRVELLTKMKLAITRESGNRLTPVDFTSALEDMSPGTAYTMSLNRAGAQLTQEVDILMKNAGRQTEEESKKLIKRLAAIDKKIAAMSKDKSGVFEAMLQPAVLKNTVTGDVTNTHAFVTEYSPEWFDTLKRLRDRRNAIMASADKRKMTGDPIVDEQIKLQMSKSRKSAWDNYWNQMNNIAVFADITKLFDSEGEFLADYSAERNRLVQELGERRADELIRKTQRSFHRYLDDRDAHQSVMAARVAEGVMTAEEAAQSNLEFVQRYSPEIFFNKESKGNEGDRYLVPAPKMSNPKFYDSRYFDIMNDSDLSEVYTELRSIVSEMKSYLPMYVQYNTPENFLPYIPAHLLNDMNLREYWQTMGDRIVDSLASDYEPSNKDRIPVRFTTGKDGQSYSRDIIRVTELFGMMALHYKNFAHVQDAVEIGHTILKETDRMRRNGAERGQVLTHTLNSLQYAKDYMMYKNARALEGKTGVKLYSANPAEQLRISKQVKDLMIQRSQLEKELLDPPIGKTSRDIRKELDDLDKRIEGIGGKNIYLSKVGDRLIGINQLKALAFNPFSGFANLAFGMASLSIYANGRADFDMKTAGTAMRLVLNSTTKYLTFGKVNNPTAQKIMAIMERSGMMGDVVDSQYGESNISGRQNKLKKAVDPYTFLRSSDYFMKASVLVATMLNTKVGDVSVWDAFDKDGNWTLDNSEEWATEGKQWSKFRNRAVRISQIVMGNMDKNSPKLMNKYILGRLIGQFRASWLPEGWAARWEDEKHDAQLGRKIKGRYRTYGDIGIAGSTTILARQFMGMFTKVNYFDGVVFDSGTNAGKLVSESQVDMENMRRNFTGMMWTLTMMGAVLMLKHMRGDDDDDSFAEESLMIALNMMNRVNQDLQFYSSPDVANNLIRNAIPAADVVNDYIKAVKATHKALSSEDYDWDQALLKWTKATPYLNLINKFNYMSSRDISEVSR